MHLHMLDNMHKLLLLRHRAHTRTTNAKPTTGTASANACTTILQTTMLMPLHYMLRGIP